LLVSLGQSGDSGLFQDGILGQSRDRRGNIGSANAVFGTGKILHLVADNPSRTLEPVNGCTDAAAKGGNGLDGSVDGCQRGGSVGLRQQVID
jgi:hypothetical protein